MAFDAGTVLHVANETDELLRGGKVEKIYQPQRDEIIISVRSGGETKRLLINVASSNARMGLTSMRPDNPANPPMFCMMLRKHFQGAKFVSCKQIGFERAVRITFDAYDSLGFLSHKHIIVEIMGTYSNLIITDKDDKILGAAKLIDLSTNHKRQILPGMIYEVPPKQDKLDPTAVSENDLLQLCIDSDPDIKCEKFIISKFSGIAPVVAREIAFRSGGSVTATLTDCHKRLSKVFFECISKVKECSGHPWAVKDQNGRPVEYSFIELTQYVGYESVEYSTFGEMIDAFYLTRATMERTKLRSADVHRILSNAEKRVSKKLSLMRCELDECEMGDEWRLYGDLITANIFRLKKGDAECTLENYYDGMKPVRIKLDTNLSPAANAQKYYKKYSKTKSAREHLTKQIELAEAEYEYIFTVFDSLSRAETEKEVSEIRSELYHSGYASKMRNYSEKKKQTPSYDTYRTSGGLTVLCGKNNLANDYLTFKVGEKTDWWFHVKGMPGSHVILKCPKGEEPDEVDFTEAATVAACNSKAGDMTAVDVDYTLLKNVKKPPSSKPGFVIYHTNYSARVVADPTLVTKINKK